jgi:hypothetical protein
MVAWCLKDGVDVVFTDRDITCIGLVVVEIDKQTDCEVRDGAASGPGLLKGVCSFRDVLS